MDKKPEALDLEKIDAGEFARLKADARALERDVQADRDAQAQRDVLDQAWREQEEYTRAVSEMKEAERRPRLLALSALFVAAVAGVALWVYSQWPTQPELMSEADALRLA